MQFGFTGGIYVRIDPSQNLGIFDQAGTERVQIIGGVISGVFNVQATFNGAVGLNTNHTDFNNYSTGVGVTITPKVSNRIALFASMAINNLGSAAGLVGIGLYRNTTSIPLGNALATGTQLLVNAVTQPSATAQSYWPIGLIDTGLTLGTAYNYYTTIETPTTNGGQGVILVYIEAKEV